MKNKLKLLILPILVGLLSSCEIFNPSTSSTTIDQTTVTSNSDESTETSDSTESTQSSESSNIDTEESSSTIDEPISDSSTEEESSQTTTEETSASSSEDEQSSSASEDESKENTYYLVQNLGDLNPGDKIIIANKETGYVMTDIPHPSKSSYLSGSKDATFIDNKLITTAAVVLYVEEANDGIYTFSNEEGEYFSSSASRRIGFDLSGIEWKVSFDEDANATILNANESYGFLCYVNGNNYFTTFTSVANTRLPVQIYRDGQIDPVYPESITLSSKESQLTLGATTKLSVSYLPKNTNQRNVSFKVEDETIASVDEKGVVKGLNFGKTSITATALTENSFVTASFEIEVIQTLHTIMVYMCGADLESKNDLGTADLNELTKYAAPSGANIVIQTGGANSWNKKYGITANKLQRWHVSDKNTLTLDETLNYASMGASSTLQSFVEYGLTEFPAERTGLILWNHGGGMDGVCYDERANDDCLTAAEVCEAMNGAFKNTGRTEKLEWIGYDACLMGVLDIASVNADYFNYMVGSEELVDGEGWNYDDFLKVLYADLTISTPDLLDAACDAYVKEGYDYGSGVEATLAAYDLSKIDAAISNFETFAEDLNIKSKSDFNKLKEAAKSSLNFGEYGGQYLYGNVDLIELLENCDDQFSNLDTADLVESIDELVISNYYGNHYKEKTGFPCGICAFVAYTNGSGWYGLQITKSHYSVNDTKLQTWRTININYGDF